NTNLATPLIDVALGSISTSLQLPDATQVGKGTFIIINNLSAFNQAILDASGHVIVASQAPGAIFFYYLQDNSTSQGTWFAFQYGAAIAAPSAAALAGPGLRAVGATLGQDIVVATKNSVYTLTTNDQTTLLVWTGGGGNAFNLPSSASLGPSWYV